MRMVVLCPLFGHKRCLCLNVNRKSLSHALIAPYGCLFIRSTLPHTAELFIGQVVDVNAMPNADFRFIHVGNWMCASFGCVRAANVE